MPTRNLTILFTDIQGFTARTSSETRAGVANLLANHERLLAPTFAHYGGKVIKTIGDAFLVTFESPTDAVVCGLAIQEVLRQHNAPLPPERHLKVRVAINVGEVELKDGDIFGEPVNLAARLEGITEAGEVYFTEAVYLTMNRREAPATEVGERTFKGIPGTVRVYKVVQDTASEQLQALSRTVAVDESGSVKFLSRAEDPPAVALGGPGGKRSFLAPGIALVFILGAVGVGIFVEPIIAERMVVTRAHALVDGGTPEAALALLTKRLDDHPGSIPLRDYALRVANTAVDARVKKNGSAAGLAFIQTEVKAHPSLSHLADREPALDADVTMADALENLHEYQIWETARKLVNRRYPSDPNVPYVVAERLRKRMVPSSVLWLYEDALKRGHAKTDSMFEACTEVLAGKPAQSHEANEALAMLDHVFPKRKLAWAKKALTSGNGWALANAWPILAAAHEPKLSDPWLQALRGVMVGDPIAPAATLETQMDATRGRRAQTVLAQALRREGLTAEQKDALHHAALTLEARFGPLPEH